jgi:hypothetical protein
MDIILMKKGIAWTFLYSADDWRKTKKVKGVL